MLVDLIRSIRDKKTRKLQAELAQLKAEKADLLRQLEERNGK